MVRRESEIKVEPRENMLGGVGSATCRILLEAERFSGAGRVFNIISLEPGNSIGRHQHVGEQEVFYFLEGEGIYDDDGEITKVQAGEMAFCEDGQSHCIEAVGEKPLVFIALVTFTK